MEQYRYTYDLNGNILTRNRIIKENLTEGITTENAYTSTIGEASIENEIAYTGGIYDEKTGLYYLNARYYTSPSNELCELLTDLCKKLPNL